MLKKNQLKKKEQIYNMQLYVAKKILIRKRMKKQ